MNGTQVRAARKLLGWSTERLGCWCDFPASVVQKFEKTGYIQRSYSVELRPDRVAILRAALEAAGVMFTDGEEPGVRLRKMEGRQT